MFGEVWVLTLGLNPEIARGGRLAKDRVMGLLGILAIQCVMPNG